MMNRHAGTLTKITPRLQKEYAGWGGRHLNAIACPIGSERGFISMLRGWLKFADDHSNEDYKIGEDYYTGPIWARIGVELRGLLSCDIGQRLDCGTLDKIILSALKDEGFNEDGERDE